MKFIVEENRITSTFHYGDLSISPDDSQGYRPFELFVSSLAGCSGMLLRSILVKKRLPFEKIETVISAERNPSLANKIEQLSITAHVMTAAPYSTNEEEKIAQLVIKNCGMIQSVIHSIDLTFKVISSK
ncbi:OsmC family protein [Rossellomorea vietnamensis]|uniref:OsmC family protein n=1 Tax=Rossellomorea vietnamensis TaxID=218284 RepID=A0A5D4MH56_9BACI|nr:OsmC family protein [Rossellomorea vietnamensis]TYS01215.1 OsmC family protein [Rossellomorea vietnamensis]